MDRSRVVIMTKCNHPVNDPSRQQSSSQTAADIAQNPRKWTNKMGLSRKHIMDAVDASVQRLGTYIDVLQIHRLDRDVPPEEI